MPDDNNIKHFTAADIEKYHKGLLSSKERHALEKAALDDPFLADALEGYATAGVNVTADIDELKKKLFEKTESSKVIPMNRRRSSAFVWWRVAAMVILVAGAGLLVYQFAFNKKSESIAQNTSNKEEQPVSKDSVQTNLPLTQNEADKQVNTESLKNNTLPKKDNATTAPVIKQTFGASQRKTDTVENSYTFSTNKPVVNPTTTQPSANNGDIVSTDDKKALKQENVTLNQTNKPKISEEKEAFGKVASNEKSPNANGDGVKDQFDRNGFAGVYKTNQGLASNRRNENSQRNNIFRGRVMDINNNPLPFANITNTVDSVGTYADAKGYFNITSPDTVLNVQVQSLGFNNTTTQLRNSVLNNEVQLKEDKSLAEVVISKKKINSKLSLDDNMKVEEPEPADGWGNYDIYLANNIKIPEDIRAKQPSGEVEISFDVYKNGEPINIKVEKSLCKPCDQEAIRLIKQGPKWKRKAKKGRASVTVSFE
ncbi:MAG: carboxypeptidase-like regulatory domain-containing protein [Chitinophagales bacterium]